ncbi:diaminopimelate decarboxylase [Alphaproteobacteria bacterium]|nr:diaminopimelate decarboxylase [Alphaproteobacteria bacterium]
MQRIGYYRKSGELFLQNKSLIKLADHYGTPTFIYDSNLIKNSFYLLKNIMDPLNGKIHFAVKSNDNLGIIKYINNLGAGADVVSIGELKRCLAVSVKPEDIIFSGVGKQKDEIEFAIGQNIKQLNAESIEELKDIIEISKNIKKRVNVAIRVNLDINAKTHKKISTGDENSKFGIIYDDIVNAYKLINEASFVNPFGLAIHVGSQLFDYDVFFQTFLKIKNLAIELRSLGYEVNHLDLGGGFGIDYTMKNSLDYKSFSKALNEVFRNEDFQLSVEPGRSLIAESGILLTKVIRTKSTNLKNFLIVDAAMNNLIRPTLYNATHSIKPIKIKSNRSSKKYDIVGPICETGDFLGIDFNLQETKKNEVLAIMTCGAYGSVMRSNYNSRPSAAEVFIFDNKEILLRKREEIDQLLKLDIIPNF